MGTLHPTRTRKSLPLSTGDLEDLEYLRHSEAHRAALAYLVEVDVSASMSEAALLRAIFEAGLRAVRDLAEEDGYAQMARDRAGEDRQAVARRRRPGWAGE